jgi:chromosomal replication initiator protein
MEHIWSQVQESLRSKLGPQNFEIWIRPIQITAVNGGDVELEVPNRYYQEWIQANYGADLCSGLSEALGHPVEVRFRYAQSVQSADSPTADELEYGEADATSQEAKSPRTAPGVATDKNFDNFIVGSCNQFAHAAALAVAEHPGDPQYNPLFIYGSTGLGKTHLLHAVANQVLKTQRDAQVLYVTAEQFTTELIEALRYRQMPEFRNKFRKQPTLLLMDDVQFLSAKDRTQEELFHTFQWLKERGHQIVFTADVLPREIKGLEPRLRTRCESGMLADTQPPDIETLTAILLQKAAEMNLDLPDELIQYIVPRIGGSIRELEGVLHRLSAECRLRRVLPTLEFARRHLGSLLIDEVRAPTSDEIIQTVANFYNIKISDLKGTRRLKQLVRPRHVAMFLVRKHTELSFPDIGRAFGRDHATVQHACKKIRTQIQRDVDLQSAIDTLSRQLGR